MHLIVYFQNLFTMRLYTCCFCFNLITGTKIIGAIYLVRKDVNLKKNPRKGGGSTLLSLTQESRGSCFIDQVSFQCDATLCSFTSHINMCTTYIYHIYTTCSPTVHHIYTTFTPHVNHMYTICTQRVHKIYTKCTQHVLHMFTKCTPHAYNTYTKRTYTINTQHMLGMYMTHVHIMYTTITPHVHQFQLFLHTP